jgi:cytochrome c
MKLYDRGKIIAGIVIFLILITLPFWYGRGKAVAPPQLDLDTPAIGLLADKSCVEDAAWMRENHMKLLDAWRDSVVREGNRTYTAKNGKVFEMGLTGNCLKCHSNKDRFCDRCHDYVGVKPSCFNCHIVPGEVRR